MGKHTQILLVLMLVLLFKQKVFSQDNTNVPDSLKKVELWYDDEYQVRKLKSIYYVLKDNQDIMHGKMVSFYENGGIISEGEYRMNQPHGIWKYYFENGDLKMEGDLTSSTSGYWKYYFESGELKQEGPIDKNKQNGLWKYYYENGKPKSSGTYNYGIKDGSWLFYYESGQIKAKANYQEGKGSYKEFYEGGGIKMEGETVNNQSEGIWTYYYPSGKVKSKGYELHGVKNGHWEYFYENGQKSSEGNYVDGKLHDNWKYYYDDGNLSSEGEHYEGDKDGHWKLYHKNGAFKGEGVFKRGDGEYKEYYENGNLKIQGNVQNNENEGRWVYYYEDGSVEGECMFTKGAGDYVGYHKNGETKMKGEIEGNHKVGTWELYNDDGSLAGYYKTVYDQDGGESFESEPVEPNAENETEEELKPIADRHLPHYRYKAKRKSKLRYFQPRVNELEGIIISGNPLGLVNTVLPFFIEYYYQERLGYEMQYTIRRNPFFISDEKIPNNVIYNRGQSVDFAQRFYQPGRSYGMLYFGHRLRIINNKYYVTINDTASTVPSIEKIQALENTIEYSLFFGDRIFGNYRRPGLTFDIFVSLGVGYRWFEKKYVVTPVRETLFSVIPQKPIFIPYRLEFSFGYLF